MLPLPILCLLDCLSRARPSGTPHGFPYCGSLLRRWVGSTEGTAILCLLSSPDVGGSPTVSQSVISLADPPLTRNPRSRGSGGSLLVCLNHDCNQNSKAFHRRWLLAMTDSLPHRSHAHLTTRSSRQATSDPQLICLLSAGAAHLTLVAWGGRLTSYLYSVHKSDFQLRTTDTWHRHSGVLSSSKSGFQVIDLELTLVVT